MLELAEWLQAPVVAFRSGKGIVASDHHLGFSCAEGFERWADTDVLIGIGSRLELQWFRWPDQPRGLRIVDIDIDPDQPGRVGADVAVIGDAAAASAALSAALREVRPEAPSRREEFEALKARKHAEIQRITPHVAYVQAIREVLPRDGFFVEELCQAGFASYFAFPVYEPRTFVTAGAQGTLGFGFQTALGVKAGNPGRKVVSITGDGGFQFGVAELATAAQYGLDVVTVLFNNNAYGNVLADQTRRFGGRVLGARLRNPDFVALAESYGVRAARASTPQAAHARARRGARARRAGADRGPARRGRRALAVGVPDAAPARLGWTDNGDRGWRGCLTCSSARVRWRGGRSRSRSCRCACSRRRARRRRR